MSAVFAEVSVAIVKVPRVHIGDRARVLRVLHTPLGGGVGVGGEQG